MLRSSTKRIGWSMMAVLVLCVVALMIAIGVNLVRQHDSAVASQSDPVSRLDAYLGIGTWVDLFDAKAWLNPVGVLDDMERQGVSTLFIETATARSSRGIVNPRTLARFIAGAHARHIYVVGWYPPSMRAGTLDYDRVMEAIRFTTPDGQRFDSVALDIESTVVKPVGTRNRRVVELSQQIRSAVGTDYPLGAIIPSPVGLAKQTGFWDAFPYTQLAETYDVFAPMSYYTFHSRTAAGADADARASMRILRAQIGCSTIPVHLIGGLAGPSSAAAVKQFARVGRETGCVGASIYDYVGMNDAKWQALDAGWNGRAK